MTVVQIDPIINLFNNNKTAVILLGRVWELLYFEGTSPDVGKRRENFIVTMLKHEFNLPVEQAPSTEKSWDFNVLINGQKRYYSLKTAEASGGYSIIKVAWDGFPSKERVLNYEFKHNILYVQRNKRLNKIEMFVFDVNDLQALKEKSMESYTEFNNIWWLPKSNTNPRGFGLQGKAVKQLIQQAKEKGNYTYGIYPPLKQSEIGELKEAYFKGWYRILKELALRGLKQ